MRMSELSSMAKATHLKDFVDLDDNKVLQQLYSYMQGWCSRHLGQWLLIYFRSMSVWIK